MPRPKVLPANRLRAPEACLACRASKKRCSGTFPCSKCIRNGRADSCVPFRRSNTTCTSAPRQTNNAYRAPTSPDAGRRSRNTSSAGLGSLPQLLPAMNGTSGAPHKTHSRMLRDRKGEQGTISQDPATSSGKAILMGLLVYIGRAASLSFLQLLRDTVTQHIGPSQFSHNITKEDMLETDTPDEVLPSLGNDPDPQDEQSHLRTYQIAVSSPFERSR